MRCSLSVFPAVFKTSSMWVLTMAPKGFLWQSRAHTSIFRQIAICNDQVVHERMEVVWWNHSFDRIRCSRSALLPYFETSSISWWKFLCEIMLQQVFYGSPEPKKPFQIVCVILWPSRSGTHAGSVIIPFFSSESMKRFGDFVLLEDIVNISVDSIFEHMLPKNISMIARQKKHFQTVCGI